MSTPQGNYVREYDRLRSSPQKTYIPRDQHYDDYRPNPPQRERSWYDRFRRSPRGDPYNDPNDSRYQDCQIMIRKMNDIVDEMGPKSARAIRENRIYNFFYNRICDNLPVKK